MVTQAVSAALCGANIFRNYREYLSRAADWKIDGELSVEMFTTGFSMATMMLLVELIWSVSSVLVCWTLGRPLDILLTATENLGSAVTEPVIWCLYALFLAGFYVTIGHQKQIA